MSNVLLLTEKLLNCRFDGWQDIHVVCREIASDENISVVSATVTNHLTVKQRVTAVWNMKSLDTPVYLHISSDSHVTSADISLRSIDGNAHSVSSDGILYARSSGRYITLITSDGREIVTASTFAAISEKLGGTLARIHRSYAADLRQIAEISAKAVTLKNGVVLPLSRNYSASVRAAVKRIRYE
ncbi:MAG: LytTR family transcriptional regulator DNA-binding domain-containing protein [Clostridia bacterium]|nr:LytTR family transcriptional regulator DNA-binding domain-containing protein [Clostridia bacterium]